MNTNTQRNESMEQMMEPIPSWFRWLIIVIATLIMCACRAPLQQAPTQSVLKQSVSEPIVAEGQSVLTTLTKLRASYDLDPDYVARNSEPALVASNPPEPSAFQQAATRCVPAPIIRRTGDVRVQEMTQLAGSKPEHQAPIYFKVDDAALTVAPAQAIVPAENSVSPFLDDPELPPVGDSTPLAPIVDPSFLEPAPIQNEPTPAYPQQQYAPTQNQPVQTYPEHQYAPIQQSPVQQYPVEQYTPSQPANEIIINPISEPIIGEYEAAPLAPGIVEGAPALPAPFDYLPQAEIPIEVAPEQWATLPCESMPISYGELSQRYPDEYICDGGDAMGEVSVLPDWTINNLDPEDTVGHFDTLDRTVEVAASNRVCIYAPRFAAVRKVTSPFQSEKHEQVLIEKRDDLAVTQQQDLASVSFEQSVMPQRSVSMQPTNSLQRDIPGITGVHTLPVRMIDHDLSVHEDFRVMKFGVHKQADKPRLAEYTAKAITWSHDTGVQVVVDEVIARSNLTYNSVESIHTIGDNRPAKLRVIKTASVADALPGEEVEFTLRFDNVGHQPMGNVTIVDNLTTRLEYLKGTELCSLEGEFVQDENEVESLTLRWEIKDPIKPGNGGVIRFKCRVR